MKIFKKDGEFNLTKELPNLLDTILLILTVESFTTLNEVNLELRKCGFFLTNPELDKIFDKLIEKGLVEKGIIE